jgi:hypothetical protein
MPVTFEGIGTAFCSASGDVYWGAEADRDAVECFVVLYIPLVPLRAVHVFDHKVNLRLASVVTGIFNREYQYVSIKYRRQLFARALFRRISGPLWVLGVLGALFGLLGENVSDAWRIGLGAAGIVLLAGMALSTWSMWWTDRRNKNIRYVLGRHEGGSSDPASWTEELLDTVSPPLELFKTKTYGGAVAGLVAAGKFSQAMWAARLCMPWRTATRANDSRTTSWRTPMCARR